MVFIGEVVCIGSDFEDVFFKLMILVGFCFLICCVLLSIGLVVDKVVFFDGVCDFVVVGVEFCGIEGIVKFFQESGMLIMLVYWFREKELLNVFDLI